MPDLLLPLDSLEIPNFLRPVPMNCLSYLSMSTGSREDGKCLPCSCSHRASQLSHSKIGANELEHLAMLLFENKKWMQVMK